MTLLITLIYWIIPYFVKNKDEKSFYTYLTHKASIKIINSIFFIVISYVPIWYLWLYSRNESFIIYDFFNIQDIMNILSLERFFLLLGVFVYLILPLFAKYINEKHKRFITIIIFLLSTSPFLYLFYYGWSQGEKYYVISMLLMFFSIFLYMLIFYIKNITWVKATFLGGVSILFLIFNPIFTDNQMTKNTLRYSNLGSFKATLYYINDKNISSGIDVCLLFMTQDKFYVKIKAENYIYHAQNYIIRYNAKYQCDE